MTLSDQQKAILHHATFNTGSINVIARAGTGKTTTGVHVAKRLSGQVFFGAYNKAIADEIKSRTLDDRNITAGTLHSLGLAIWKSKYRFRIDGRKVYVLARKMYRAKALVDTIVSGVSYAKAAGFGVAGCPEIDSLDAWDELADHYDLWDELPTPSRTNPHATPEHMIKAMQTIYCQSLAMCLPGEEAGAEGVIDFDDMLLAPLYCDVQPGRYQLFDWFLLDEAQDSNLVRRLLAIKCLKPNGRMIALGDPFQAVYGFSGATNDAMSELRGMVQAVEMPLTVTYRCPKAVVVLANDWVKDLTAHESAPEGVVRAIDHREFWHEQLNPKTDVVLCRITRPLVGIARMLRQQGIPCVVEGENSRPLVSLATRWGDECTVERMLGLLGKYQEEKCAEYLIEEKLVKAEMLRERVAIIQDIAQDSAPYEPVYQMLGGLERLFEVPQVDDGTVLRLCTVHRSKGREWDRVFLIGRNRYMPSKWAKKDWEQQQEKNLMYVAVTRAKREFVDVDVPGEDAKMQGDWWDRL